MLASHIRAVASALPVMTFAPSDEKATAFTHPECPMNVRTMPPVAASRICAVPLQPPITTFDPSGEKAAALTDPVP